MTETLLKAWTYTLLLSIGMAIGIAAVAMWQAGSEMQAGRLPLEALGTAAKCWAFVTLGQVLIHFTGMLVNWAADIDYRWWRFRQRWGGRFP